MIINQKNMNVEIKEIPAMNLAAIHHVGNYIGDAALFEKLFSQLGQWAGPKGLFGPDTVFLSAYNDDPETTDPD